MMEKCMKILDMKNIAEMLLASKEELEKCKTKDMDLSDYTINSTYAKAALEVGVRPVDAYE